MSAYNNVLGVLQAYRNELETQTHEETNSAMSGNIFEAFVERGPMSAFATPLSNVHATGVGIRMKKGKMVEGEFVIKVYVFNKFDLGSNTPELTKRFKNVDVDVEQMPIQLALSKAIRHKLRPGQTRTAFTATTIAQHRSRQRPVIGGISIAPLNTFFAGTLGCFLARTVGDTNQLFALSNNHVMADTNRLPVGTSIVQPGPEVAPTKPGDIFAALSAFIPINFPGGRLDPVVNVFDAAIAIVPDESLIKRSAILGITKFTPKPGIPLPGMRVTKSGRTTGVTTGIIKSTGVNGVQVNYGTPDAPRIATFNETIQIVGDDGKPFSLPGDSGSVILDRDSGQPVALLFAGDGSTTTACDMAGVCKQFKAFPV